MAWPTVPLAPEAFARFYTERAALGPLDTARFGDLYLACACSTGEAHALAAFEAAAVPQIRSALARLRLDATAVDETLQLVRRDLFTGEAPKILAYGGQGDLFGWTKVVATRIALKLGRKTKREVSSDEVIAQDASSDGDPEMMLLRAHYKHAFQDAVAQAIAALEPRDAMLIKQNTVDGLSIDDLAQIHRIHRATAARWLQKARETLIEGIRETFRSSSKLTPTECESVLRLVQSRFDVTLRRHLEKAALFLAEG